MPGDARDRLPIGFAHRGGRHPGTGENTLGAFSTALAAGASGLESDAWMTADGVVVLDHDGTVGWRRRPIRSLPRRALSRHIPTLEELYEAVGTDFELSLDVKDPAAAPAVVEVAAGAGAADRLWLCHADPGVLAAWSRLHPGVKRVRSTTLRSLGDPTLALPAIGDVDALNLRASEWTAPLLERVHAAGLLAFGWDAHDRPTIARLVSLGIDGVYGNDVAALVEVLAGARP